MDAAEIGAQQAQLFFLAAHPFGGGHVWGARHLHQREIESLADGRAALFHHFQCDAGTGTGVDRLDQKVSCCVQGTVGDASRRHFRIFDNAFVCGSQRRVQNFLRGTDGGFIHLVEHSYIGQDLCADAAPVNFTRHLGPARHVIRHFEVTALGHSVAFAFVDIG